MCKLDLLTRDQITLILAVVQFICLSGLQLISRPHSGSYLSSGGHESDVLNLLATQTWM